MPHVHEISFISPYGKLWTLFYTMESRDTIGEILEIRVDGNSYHVTSFKRQNQIIKLAEDHGADLYETAADYAEDRATYHFVDN